MPLFMLDTDTVSLFLRGQSPALDARVTSTSVDVLCISVVTRGELLYGVRLKPDASRLARLVDLFLARVPSLPWDNAAADRFATVAAELTRTGSPIGSLDTMIAGHALAVDAILVTNNTRHFSRIAALTIDNWAEATSG